MAQKHAYDLLRFTIRKKKYIYIDYIKQNTN